MVEAEAQYIVSRQTASQDPQTDGFIFHTADAMVPYFATQAATALALTRAPKWLPAVERYMAWHFRHLNWPDELGLYGTTYDYKQVGGAWQPDLAVRTGKSKHYYDSVDSYAATFITLLRAYVASGGDAGRLTAHRRQIEAVAELMIQMMDPADGLTIAKPTYAVKYLMDNCEVYKGLRDAAWLFQEVFADPGNGVRFHEAAERNRQGILTGLADGPDFLMYKVGKKRGRPTWTQWYPDVVAQLFPVIFGVVAPGDPRAERGYARLGEGFPQWHTFGSAHTAHAPWALVAYAGAVLGKVEDVQRYRQSAEAVYISTGRPSPWNVAESAWFLMTNLHMDYSAAGWRGYP